jgi:hypothetical protein
MQTEHAMKVNRGLMTISVPSVPVCLTCPDVWRQFNRAHTLALFMKNISWIRPFKSRLRTALSLAVVSITLAPIALLTAAEADKQESKTQKATEQKSEADSSKTKPKAAPKKLSGAELYSMHCNRCHPERYPTERTAAHWKTILIHMRVRANMPAEQSRTILKYLQDNSGR